MKSWLSYGRLMDGAIGTELCKYRRSITIHKSLPCDWISISEAGLVKDLYRKYISAGAQIISTNTFCSNANSLNADPKTICALNHASCKIAREIADEANSNGNEVKVLGIVGPGMQRTEKEFNQQVEAFNNQISLLIAGSVDMIMLETIYDKQILIAALEGYRKAVQSIPVYDTDHRVNSDVPLMVSFALRPDGKSVIGTPLDEMVKSLVDFPEIISVGLNCIPADINLRIQIVELKNYIEKAGLSDILISCHPNLGHSDIYGSHHISAESYIDNLKSLIQSRLIHIAGGCCGTTPTLISQLANAIKPPYISCVAPDAETD